MLHVAQFDDSIVFQIDHKGFIPQVFEHLQYKLFCANEGHFLRALT